MPRSAFLTVARIPRLYLVQSERPGDKTKTRRYLTPEAAEERARLMREERPDAVVTVTPSYPVTFPRESDPHAFDMPDSLVDRATLQDFLEQLGIRPDAVESITITEEALLVEYQPDPKRARTPQTWRVGLTD